MRLSCRCLIVVLFFSLSFGAELVAQRGQGKGKNYSARKSSRTQPRNHDTDSNEKKQAGKGGATAESNEIDESNQPITSEKLDPALFLHPCYKLDAVVKGQNTPLNFLASDSQWDQPDGPGSSITVTYSYSNLLDGNIQGLAPEQLRLATKEAMSVWASVIPINFIEITDTGPDPTSGENAYSRGDSADIRIGAHVMDGVSGGELAHAFLPYSNSAGLAGDLHFDVDENWGESDGGFFLETMLHELGHVLGLDHVDDVEAIMNPIIMNRFGALGEAFLLDDDIAGAQSIYGTGTGSVTPLPEEEQEEETEEDTEVDPSLENDITAELNTESGLLSLTGDAMDNGMVVYASRWLTVVQGYNGTTINGESGMYWFRRNGISLEVATSGGNDHVYLFGVSTDSATVDLGAGDDGLAVIFSRIETLDGNGGEGEDRLFTFFNRIGDVVESSFESVW